MLFAEGRVLKNKPIVLIFGLFSGPFEHSPLMALLDSLGRKFGIV